MAKTDIHLKRPKNNFLRAQQPKTARLKSLFAEGLAQHRAGRLADAEAIYRRVLAEQPDHFDCLHMLGVIFLQRKNPAGAIQQIDLALKRVPNDASALNNRGVALQELKQLENALASFECAISSRADYADAHSNRANILKALQRHEEALAGYAHAVALRPDLVEAHSNRGDAFNHLKRFGDALASCDRALTLRPNFADAHCHRAIALRGLKRFDEALSSCDRALALRPDFAEAHCNRGNIMLDLHRFEEALENYDRALALRPDFAEAHSNRGSALQNLRRYEEALASCDRALALRPDFAEAHSNRGSALQELRRFDEALASFDRAAALWPNFAEAHSNAALCLLLTGDFGRGFREYEERWQTDQLRHEKRNFPQPLWTGAGEATGKTILIHAEQGFGDTIHFCRYVPQVAQRAARVIFEVQKPLTDLMKTLAGGAQIIAKGDPLPDFDVHCPLISLPLVFDTQLATIPGETPYLFAAQSKSGAWRDRLGRHVRPRIGLVWAGDPRKSLPNAHRLDQQRSVAFDVLAPILEVRECEFYSLQKGEQAVAQLQRSPLRERVIDWSEDFPDFSDTAALIDNLDLVIAVDTSVAHLAGALGKPFWLLNRYNTCWRWLLDRDDSPWYPTARLFRQDQRRQWNPVVDAVATALHEFASSWELSASP